jgi:hypothetical protein
VLVEKSSADSFGLQILDVCMWLLRRALDNGDVPQGNCRILFESLVERSMISRFSFETLLRSVESGSQYVDDLPLTEEQLEKGKEILAQFEENRQRRMLREPEALTALPEGTNRNS